MHVRNVRVFVIGLLAILIMGMAVSAFAQSSVGEKVKVAVLPFEIFAGDELSYLKDSLPELLHDRLVESGFAAVEPSQVQQYLAEKGITKIDSKIAREVAVNTGAAFAVFGSFSQIGETLDIDARLVEAFGTSDGRHISVNEQGLINLLPAVDNVVDTMKKSLLRQDFVSEVLVEGTKTLDKEVVEMRLTLQKGDILIAQSVNTALRNIYDLGYFDNVTVSVDDTPNGKIVTFTVQEKPRLQAVNVTGSEEIDSEDILEAISTKSGGVVNPKVLSDDIRVIREMYRKEGYYKAKVSHEMTSAGEGLANLTFVIDEGRKLYVENVIIDGAKQLDPDDIKKVLVVTERGWLAWIDNSGVLKEELLERDAAAINAFYNSKGFIDAKVGRPEVDITDDGINVVYQVWEGERYKMGETSFEGDLIETSEKLGKLTNTTKLLADEDFFDRSMLKKDVDKLTRYYNNYGYAYAQVGVRLSPNPESAIVDVTYTVEKHQRVHIHRILVEGNTTTRDNIILREMRLADGDMFSGFKMKRSQQRLTNLDYFEKVDISPVPTGNPDEMDLRVKVKDKATGTIGGGIGYSTYDGVYFAGNIEERNLFGKGYALAFNGGFSQTSTDYVLSFTNPHINDTNVGFTTRAFSGESEYTEYDRSSYGGEVNFFYPVGEYSTLGWGYILEDYTLKNIQDSASDEIKDEAGRHLASILSGRFTRDTVDNKLMPTEGSIFTTRLAYGGGVLGGTDDFYKLTMKHDWYIPVFEKVVFHTRGWVGYVGKNFGNENVPEDQLFELGGISSIRGYSNYTIGPVSTNSSGLQGVEGGNKALYINLELRRPISEEYGINMRGFFDMGNSWAENEMFFSSHERWGETPLLGLYKSAGVGVQWLSPMGPLGVVYGYGFNHVEDSDRHTFEFVMGQNF